MRTFKFLNLLLLSFNFCFSQSEMPIMAFHSFTPQTTSFQNFLKFKEAGFNINHTIFKTNDQVQNALDLAYMVGIKMIIYSDELITNTEKTVKRFKNHPALYGYFIGDEPSPKDFQKLKLIREKIRELDSTHLLYINLHPNYAPDSYLGEQTYDRYVKSFVNNVDVDFISFDNYPIVDNKIRNNWYENLEVIRNICLNYKKSFWGFACTTIHYKYRQPILGGLKLQQFSNLLYGAKGLQYFTYITMDDEYWRKNNYGYSVIYNNGKPTPTYNLVKNVNSQIKKLAWIFTKSKVDSVFHVGDTIPIGTKRMNFLPKKFSVFKTFGKSALVSFQSIGSRKFVIIQNKDIFKTMSFNYKLQVGVSIVDNKTGKIKIANTNENIFNIPPGDILIFTYL